MRFRAAVIGESGSPKSRRKIIVAEWRACYPCERRMRPPLPVAGGLWPLGGGLSSLRRVFFGFCRVVFAHCDQAETCLDRGLAEEERALRRANFVNDEAHAQQMPCAVERVHLEFLERGVAAVVGPTALRVPNDAPTLAGIHSFPRQCVQIRFGTEGHASLIWGCSGAITTENRVTGERVAAKPARACSARMARLVEPSVAGYGDAGAHPRGKSCAWHWARPWRCSSGKSPSRPSRRNRWRSSCIAKARRRQSPASCICRRNEPAPFRC